MALSVHALASGSSGNSTLVSAIGAGCATHILIDAGLSVRAMERSLAHFGVRPDMLSGIVLTHEHIDHVRAAQPLARKYGVPLIANAPTLRRLFAETGDGVAHEHLRTGGRMRFVGIEVETFPVPHDAAEPVGINIYAGGYKVSHITDAGCITPAMRRAVSGAHLLIAEANHDVYRLKAGPYPPILKQRILSDRGHLSNEACVSFLVDHLRATGPCAIWLAHLSKTNNLPKLAENYARATLKLEARHPFVLGVALRDRPSLSWTPGAFPLQLSLFS